MQSRVRIGSIILPVFVKKRETSLQRSAIRAICSSDPFFPSLRVFFIKSIVVIGPQAFATVIPEKALLIDKYKPAF